MKNFEKKIVALWVVGILVSLVPLVFIGWVIIKLLQFFKVI